MFNRIHGTTLNVLVSIIDNRICFSDAQSNSPVDVLFSGFLISIFKCLSCWWYNGWKSPRLWYYFKVYNNTLVHFFNYTHLLQCNGNNRGHYLLPLFFITTCGFIWIFKVFRKAAVNVYHTSCFSIFDVLRYSTIFLVY